MINWKIIEKVFDEYYICNNPGLDCILYHLNEDATLGFYLEYDKNQIVFFNYDKVDFYGNDIKLELEKNAIYCEHPIPINISELVNLIFNHKCLDIFDYTLDEAKELIINNYNRMNEEKIDIDLAVNKILAKWKDEQKVMIIEELSELITALLHYERGKINKEALISEVADVEIMLMQLKIIYDIKAIDVENEKIFKIKRTLNKMN